jgi:hypothetical protein
MTHREGVSIGEFEKLKVKSKILNVKSVINICYLDVGFSLDFVFSI